MKSHTTEGMLGDAESYLGAESFIVGLTPSFWAHVPLSISQIHNLQLVDGVNCRTAKCKEDTVDLQTACAFTYLPISKCRIVGTIVAVDRRGNGSVIYVIDDGTGTIDCIFWIEPDIYSVPSLTSDSSDDGVFEVGEVVRAFARVECVAVEHSSSSIVATCHRTREAVRELHATLVMRLSTSRATPFSLDTECKHWVELGDSSSINSLPLHANAVLDTLGTDLSSQVARREHFPSAEDTEGAWRLFGVHCKCKLRYKDALLYCHCTATLEPMDPNFQFRDTLLAHLLEKEAEQDSTEPMRFQYKTLSADFRILDAAAKETTNLANGDARRILLLTFKALRKDGIINLLDFASDTYVLLSRARVLEPYMETILSSNAEKALERAHLKKYKPDYLSDVPKSRLQYVRRLMSTSGH